MADPDRRGSPGDRSRSTHVVAFFLVALSAYALTADYDQEQNQDVIATAVPVWTVVTNGSLDVAANRDLSGWFFDVNGRTVSNRWPGAMAMAIPAYALARPLYANDRDPVLWPATVTAVVVTAAGVTALFWLVLLEHGNRVAWSVGAVTAFGTGLWTVAADSLWTHGPAVLMAALTLHALRAHRQWLAGACFGGLVLVRPHLVIIAVLVAYVLAREERDWHAAARIGLPSIAGLVLFVGYVSLLLGRPSIGLETYVLDVPSGWDRVANIVGLLVAPRVGLLVYSPVVLCCLPRLRQAWRESGAWERAAIFGGVTYMAVQFQLNNFYGGHSFYGYRLPLEGLTFAFPLLVRSGVLMVRTARLGRLLCAALMVWSVWVHAVGAGLYVGRAVILDPWTTVGPIAVLRDAGLPIAATVVAVGVLATVVVVLAVARAPTTNWRDDSPSADWPAERRAL